MNAIQTSITSVVFDEGASDRIELNIDALAAALSGFANNQYPSINHGLIETRHLAHDDGESSLVRATIRTSKSSESWAVDGWVYGLSIDDDNNVWIRLRLVGTVDETDVTVIVDARIDEHFNPNGIRVVDVQPPF